MASRKNGICFKNFDEALAECPETYGRIDLLCAGWPCQDNSIAGTRQGHKGKRSGLWKDVKRILGIFRPQWFVGENVPGLFSVNGGEDFWQVISDLDSLGYCVAWDVLDSQKFGVAQRRERVFIVGSFGNTGAAKVLFEPESGDRNIAKDTQVRTVGLCVSARDGERQDPSGENLAASVITATDYRRTPIGQFGNEGNLVVSKPIMSSEDKMRGIQSDGRNIVVNTIRCETGQASEQKWNDSLIAHTLGSSQRGTAGRIWEETHIATADTDREREASGISYELVSPRGVVIGNAVTVNVAKWIGERIMSYENRSK
jgi:DNA-cytosine methyltransferase